MSKKITYEEVKTACEALKSEGTKVTVRAVLAITGGSMSTVLAMVRMWEESAAGPGPYALSGELLRAIQAEIGLVVAEARQQDRQALDRAAAGEKEALSGFQLAAAVNEVLEGDLKEAQREIKDTRAYYEKREAVTAERIQLQQEMIISLEQEKATLQETKTELSQQLSAARQSAQYVSRDADERLARIRGLEQQLAEASADHAQQITTLRDRIEGLVKTGAQAEQKLADQAVRLEEWKTERSRLLVVEEDYRQAMALVREYSETVKAAKQQIEVLEGEKAEHLTAALGKNLGKGKKERTP